MEISTLTKPSSLLEECSLASRSEPTFLVKSYRQVGDMMVLDEQTDTTNLYEAISWALEQACQAVGMMVVISRPGQLCASYNRLEEGIRARLFSPLGMFEEVRPLNQWLRYR